MMKIVSVLLVKVIGVEGSIDDNCWSTVDRRLLSIDTSFSIDMTMSLYLFLDMYLHSGEYHVGTVGIDIRNYIFAVLMR